MLSAALVFAACSKDAENSVTDASSSSQDVVMKINTPGPVAGRAIGGNANGVALEINDGHIVFANSSGDITRMVQIKSSGASGDDQVNVGDLTGMGGATIPKVPTNSTVCYVFANHSLAIVSTMSNMRDIRALSYAVNDLADGSGGVSEVPIYGFGSVSEQTVVSEQRMVAEVDVYAAASRIQVKGMKLKDQTGKYSVINSFTVEGILINNFFPTMKATNIFSGISIIDNGSMSEKYTLGDPAFAYVSYSNLYDYQSGGIGTPMTGGDTGYWASSDDTKYWAYNIFPNLLSAGFTSVQLPHVVIELSVQVEHDGDAAVTETRYLTIRGYKNGVTPINNFECGNSYTVGGSTGFTFDYEDTNNVPEVGTLTGEVVVTPIDWKNTDVEPEF